MGKKKDLLLLNLKLFKSRDEKSSTAIKSVKRKNILLHLPHRKKDMNGLISTPRAADMADRIVFPNDGTVMNNFVSGGQTGHMP